MGAMLQDARGVGMEERTFWGSVMFSTGPNTELQGRDGVWGANETPCHMDIPMCNCTLELDGTPVVVNGALVEDLATV